jgi:hypothetical protein
VLLLLTCGIRTVGYETYHSFCINYFNPYNKVIETRRMICVEYMVCVRVMRNVYEILGRKPERKRPLERPRNRWQDD